MYRIWLKTFYDSSKFDLTTKMLSEEMVQSDSPERPDKNLENYYNSLDEMFKSFYYVLKPKSLAIFTLKLGKSKYFNTLIEIINRLGRPVISTSANISGSDVITNVNMIEDELKDKIDYIEDAGEIVGVESTVIRVVDKELKILRDGILSDKIRNYFNMI